MNDPGPAVVLSMIARLKSGSSTCASVSASRSQSKARAGARDAAFGLAHPVLIRLACPFARVTGALTPERPQSVTAGALGHDLREGALEPFRSERAAFLIIGARARPRVNMAPSTDMARRGRGRRHHPPQWRATRRVRRPADGQAADRRPSLWKS
jgi:hypothetical protein